MKRRTTGIVISLILAILLGLGSLLPEASLAAKDKQSLKDLDQQIKEKQEELEAGEKKEKEMMDSIVDLEKTIDDLDGEIVNAQEDLDVLTADLKKMKKKVRRQNRDLGKRLRSMYKHGSIGFLDVLLHSGSLSELLTNLDMVQRILENDEDVLADLEKSHDRIAKKKKEVEALEQELTGARALAREERADVSRRKAELAKVNARTADDIGDLEAERQALEAELARQSQEGKISNSKSSKYGGGAFLWPLPSSDLVTSEYGWRDCPFHGREFHAAIDIGGTRTGADIVASAAGKVVHAGWYGGFGNSVIIDHGGGITTQYNHCSAVLVSEGDKVKAGQTIAQVGSTGYSTGPHLDYRVYKDGSAVSPWNYL